MGILQGHTVTCTMMMGDERSRNEIYDLDMII